VYILETFFKKESRAGNPVWQAGRWYKFYSWCSWRTRCEIKGLDGNKGEYREKRENKTQ